MVDGASEYLSRESRGDATMVPQDMRCLRRRIDWNLIPLMLLLYALWFLHKTPVNVSVLNCFIIVPRLESMAQYAAVMGLNKQLKLTSNDFSNVSTYFYLTTFVGEILNGNDHVLSYHCPSIDAHF